MKTVIVPVGFYYFGVWDPKIKPGHFLWDRHGRSVPLEQTPWDYELDARVQPEQEVPCVGMGLPSTLLSHRDGWTVLGFWDRTGDERGKSCSAFVAHGILTGHEMLAAAESVFPAIWKRLHRNLETTLP